MLKTNLGYPKLITLLGSNKFLDNIRLQLAAERKSSQNQRIDFLLLFFIHIKGYKRNWKSCKIKTTYITPLDERLENGMASKSVQYENRSLRRQDMNEARVQASSTKAKGAQVKNGPNE